MATAKFDTPKLKSYPVIPLVQVGAMSHIKSFPASGPIQKALGFPEELAEDWQEKAIAKQIYKQNKAIVKVDENNIPPFIPSPVSRIFVVGISLRVSNIDAIA